MSISGTADEFRRAMGNHASSVVVVTTSGAGRHHGVTVNSMTSVSLRPPIVLVCFSKTSETGEVIRSSGRFCLNILDREQEWISRQFVRKNVDRFENVDIDLRDGGIPAIVGAVAHLNCKVMSIQEVGDHLVVFGDVLECAASDTEPLVYWQGSYRRLAS
jgi:flavin reductase (DIM6/NTAB) family NADH-FMN oxidoreductase RutF